MIENKDVAKEISDLMIEFGVRLDKSAALVQENCSPEEFNKYRKVVGTLMAEMLLEVMNPIYVKHPNLKPKELI